MCQWYIPPYWRKKHVNLSKLKKHLTGAWGRCLHLTTPDLPTTSMFLDQLINIIMFNNIWKFHHFPQTLWSRNLHPHPLNHHPSYRVTQNLSGCLCCSYLGHCLVDAQRGRYLPPSTAWGWQKKKQPQWDETKLSKVALFEKLNKKRKTTGRR